MKKFLSIILILLMLSAILCGCADNEPEKSDMVTFSSDHGYTVSYPASYTPTSLSSDIDFVIMDETTGSNVNILSRVSEGNVLDFTEEEFVSVMEEDGMDIELMVFEFKTVNETPALVATYKYKENEITQIIYDASDNTYYATYTELPGTSVKVSGEMLTVIYSLMA